MEIKNQKGAKKVGLEAFYLKMEACMIERGKKFPILKVHDTIVYVGLQDDFIWGEGIDQLPKPIRTIQTDDGSGAEILLEATYTRSEISDPKEEKQICR